MIKLQGTEQQQVIYLRMHWGERYDFQPPATSGVRWRAIARFGEHEVLEAGSAAELLEDVRGHYTDRVASKYRLPGALMAGQGIEREPTAGAVASRSGQPSPGGQANSDRHK